MKNSPLSTSSLLALIFACLALALGVGTLARAADAPTVTTSNVLTMIQAGQPTTSTAQVQAFFTPFSFVTTNGVTASYSQSAFTATWSIADTSLSVSTTDVNGNTVWLNGAGTALATLEIANAKFAAQTASTSH